MQHHFTFYQPPSYAGDDWLITPANQVATDMVLQPNIWADYGLLLVGPKGAGKTHLAHLFAAQTNAIWLKAETLSTHEAAALLHGRTHAVLENIEHLPAAPLLFALQAAQLQPNTKLLLTSSQTAADLTHLPADIRSRLDSLPKASMLTPDDALMEALLRKQLQDAQLFVPDNTLAFLLPRLDRSFPAVLACVQWLVYCAEGQSQRLTIPALKLAAKTHSPEGLDVNTN